MNLKEIRIGNKVLKKYCHGNKEWYSESEIYPNDLFDRTEEELNGFCPIDKWPDNYKPIPLTVDWLLRHIDKNPHKKEWKGNGYDYQPETSKTIQTIFYINDGNSVIFKQEFYKAKVEDEWEITESFYLLHYDNSIFITHNEVHFLQNLYYFLNNKVELNISPD